MSVPAKRKPRSSKRRSRAHLALKKVKLNKCPKCGAAIRSHCVCASCGVYKGREAVKVKIKTKKTAEK